MKNEECSYALLSNAFILNNKSFSKESSPKLFTIHYSPQGHLSLRSGTRFTELSELHR